MDVTKVYIERLYMDVTKFTFQCAQAQRCRVKLWRIQSSWKKALKKNLKDFSTYKDDF